MDALFSLSIGVGLSAACGFRIFVPLLIMSLAARSGQLALSGGFEWIASTPALVAFGSATLLEIGAYYIPFIDNLLDTVAVPSAVVAGTLVTASQISEMDPFLTWSVAIIAGGGAAGLVQGLTTVTRQFSALTTAGLGNPIVSTLEAGASIVVTLIAITVPLVAIGGLLLLLFWAGRRLMTRRAGPPAATA